MSDNEDKPCVYDENKWTEVRPSLVLQDLQQLYRRIMGQSIEPNTFVLSPEACVKLGIEYEKEETEEELITLRNRFEMIGENL